MTRKLTLRKTLPLAVFGCTVTMMWSNPVLADGPDVKVSFKPGKGVALTSGDGNYELRFGAFGQFMTTYSIDETPILNQVLPPKEDRYQFDVSRARFDIRGHVFTPKATFRMEYDFAKEFNGLVEAWLNYAVREEVQFRAGKHKIPYNRSFLTSSSARQFTDPSWINTWPRIYSYVERELTADLGYGTGLQFHGLAFDKRFEYALSAVNGTSPVPKSDFKAPQEVNWIGKPLYALRLAAHPLGYVAYDEPDLEISKTPRFAIGASYITENQTFLQTGQVGNLVDMNGYVADFAFRWQGVSINAEYHDRHYEMADDEAATYGYNSWVAQAGYLLPILKRRMEIAGRYAAINLHHPEGGWAAYFDQREREIEYGGAVSYYFSGHDLKMVADYMVIDYKKADNKQIFDRRLARLMFQFKL